MGRLEELLDQDYTGKAIYRFELPGLLGMSWFYPLKGQLEGLTEMTSCSLPCENHLDRGVGATSSYDFLGKNFAEYLRTMLV